MSLIDLDDEFLDLFYSITDSEKPDNIDLDDMKNQMLNIVSTLEEMNNSHVIIDNIECESFKNSGDVNTK